MKQVDRLSLLQESKRSNVSRADLLKFWGSGNFGFESVCASGLSGGLVCVWDDSLFSLEGSNKNKNFLHIRGKISGCNSVVNFLNVYAPQGIPAKKEVWDLLGVLIDSYDGFWVIGGDFNAVRFREEKRNCSFKPSCASNFNAFIFEAGLVEFEMRGRRFTWHSENRQKMSKLDRFLVNSVFFNKWPEAHVQVLPNLWSDHCPIILSTKSVNFGARPFRIFNSWLGKERFKEVVVEACNSFSVPECNPDVRLVKKLALVRSRIKEWRDSMLIKDKELILQAEQEVEELEVLLETRDLSEDEDWALAENKKIIAEAELAKVMDLKQRSRVRWAKEGDKNSKFFHTMINCRKASNVIHGLFIGDEWVSKPTLVKKEVFQFFKSKFQEDCVNRPKLICPNLKKISSLDAAWVESRFSVEEIKSAVFECCGSSFIALIPKKRDHVGLGDYRPISLVGVVNKVVSKILANRLKKLDLGHSFFARASVLVNGSPTFEFSCGKGMRQGDPISPFLFVVVMEALSCIFDKAVEAGVFSEIDLPNDGPSLSHLFFADDALIIGDGVGANMNKVNNWKPVYDIVESRLALWKSAFLSIGVRIRFICSFLQSLPGYYFSLYRAPVKVVKDLEGKIRKFLWGGSNEGKKLIGFLGMLWLRLKWGWRYKCEFDNLWVKVIDSLYASGSGWSFLPDKKSVSGVWHNIVAVFNKQVPGGSMLRNFFKGVVGRGDHLYFWLNSWVTDIPFKELFPRLFSLEVVKSCRFQERLSGNWLWRHDPSLEDELTEMAELLRAVNSVSLNNSSDKWVWKGDSFRVFSVASVKKVLEGDFTNVSGFLLEWCKWVPIKCNVFVWRTTMGRIPTSDALRKRGIYAGDGLCPLCRTEDDLADHLLTSCLMATILWQKISRWCRLPPIFAFSVKDLLMIHSSGGLKSGEGVALHGIMITACWCLWLARNKALFSGVDVKVDSIFSEGVCSESSVIDLGKQVGAMVESGKLR
ncbi:uncharacterized protein LOC110888901 [Helianthus annuus]|uniref:uncharacterized protein LOC110888901 n=1 Tax=Helianthus annuus TaxID=4232 RepID=UPI0016532B56|nr:uncharacterized protein LOC110888901 [Helianthus annuus]